MNNELTKENVSVISQNIKNQIMKTYNKENILGLNGFKLMPEELDKDLEGLESEILDIMKHPRKYKAVRIMFVYFKYMEIDWSDKNEFTTKYSSKTVFKSRI